jgi:membrane protein YdbS with pleckstrin-like domain
VLSEPRVKIVGNPDLKRYILPTEKVVVATRRHKAVLLGPIAWTVAAFLVVLGIVANTPPDGQDAVNWLWLVWLAVFARLAFKWVEWRHEWFVATDKRLLLLYGLVIHKVAMMPLVKVTDMGYTRTPVGQLLGFGRFVLESAGQDQALRQIDYVPHPDATYRTLCAEIFPAPPAKDAPPAPQQPPHVPGGPTPPVGLFTDGLDGRPLRVVPGRSVRAEARPTTQPIPVAPEAAPAQAPDPAPFPPTPAQFPPTPASISDPAIWRPRKR